MRVIRTIFGLGFAGVLAGCMATTAPQEPISKPAISTPVSVPAVGPKLSAAQAARQFVRVVKIVEPRAEAECRARAPNANCDFNIVVDDRPNQPPNAFQTLDKSGRPVIAFTLALIGEARNADELAFVLGHETAHHIGGHLNRQKKNATAGALVFAGLAALTGAGAEGVRTAQELGAAVGARSYSKDFELEADALGTVITKRAGFDPVHGAQFFARIPDPGNQFLGTHPPNADRIETVRRVNSQL